MRITIDIPDDLYVRAKAAAPLRGMKLEELIAELVQLGLASPADNSAARRGMNYPIPVTIPATGRTIPSRTNAEIFEMLDE